MTFRTDLWNSLYILKAIWDENPDFISDFAQLVEPYGAGPVLGYANVLTYRTEDFMLSSAVDYKSKSRGFQ